MPPLFPTSITRREQVISAHATMTLPESLLVLQRNAIRLATAGPMEALLRAAITETLLAAYRQRFLARLGLMTNTHRDHARPHADVRVPLAVRTNLLAAYRRLDAAQTTGKGVTTATGEVTKARKTMHDALASTVQATHPLPGKGRFRGLALQVLELTASQSGMVIVAGGGTIRVGIGNIAALDQIKTPSATPFFKGGKPTKSKRQVLWRQLEFGTGAYSTQKSAQAGKNRLPSGGWWYGQRKDYSLHITGAKPGHMLRDPATQLPYAAESLRFHSTFGSLMQAALAA